MDDQKNSSVGAPEQTSEERVARAEKEAAEAQYRAEKQRERAAKAERKAKRGSLLPRKVKLGLLAACAAIIAIAVVVGVPVIKAKLNKTEYLTTSNLESIVNVSTLQTATYRYDGIAEKRNDKGDIEYRVSYASTIEAGYDMSAFDFVVDNDKKTVTPIPSDLQLGDPLIDTTSLDYMPKDPGANPKDVMAICKADVLAEIDQTDGIRAMAELNMRRAVEALLKPLTDTKGYTIEWSDGNSEESADEVEQAGEAERGEQQEAGSNE